MIVPDASDIGKLMMMMENDEICATGAIYNSNLGRKALKVRCWACEIWYEV
jgi:hypothetical protein